MLKELTEIAPRPWARIAGVFYLLNILMGAAALGVAGDNPRLGFTLVVLAAACYVAVTLLFYYLFKPVSRSLSSLAAFFSLVGCAISALSPFYFVASRINPLIFFGFYCLLIGYLISRSTFLPRILGALMALGGLGWLTFLSPRLAHLLAPYNLAPGILGEGVLTVWLLAVGVNAAKWKAQAGTARVPRPPIPHPPPV